MSSNVSEVLKSTVAIANLLKPLIDSGACKMVKSEGGDVMFVLKEGSATISINVVEHPEIKDDALVQVIAPFVLAKDLDKADSGILAEMLAFNGKFNGFAFMYDKQTGVLGLRGTLIGSTMDQLELEYLFISLAKAADALDDKLLATLKEEGRGVGEGLIKLSEEIVKILDERASQIVSAFMETLDASGRAEFENIANNDELRNAIREITFGAPAAKLTAILLSSNLSEEDRKSLARQILESLPDHDWMLRLLSFVVTSMAAALAGSAGVEASVIQARIQSTFS